MLNSINKINLQKLGNNGFKYAPEIAIVIMGSQRIYKDYKDAKPEDKKNILIKDFIILLATCLGAYGGDKIAGKLMKFIKLPLPLDKSASLRKKFMNLLHPSQIAKSLISGLGLTLGGLSTGITSGCILEKKFPTSNPKVDENLEVKLNLAKSFDYNTIIGAYGAGFIADTNYRSQSMLAGYSIGKVPGLKNKILKSAYAVSSSIIPIILTGTMTELIKNKNLFIKTIVLITTILGSCYAGNIAGNLFNKKITNELLKEELWKKYQ